MQDSKHTLTAVCLSRHGLSAKQKTPNSKMEIALLFRQIKVMEVTAGNGSRFRKTEETGLKNNIPSWIG